MTAPESHPYFSSTFADQLEHGIPDQIQSRSVVELIDRLAKTKPDSAALGYADFTASSSEPATSAQLADASNVAAGRLVNLNVIDLDLSEGESRPCVGLLCPSSIDFVIVWLALSRLGCPVLFLAPQLRPEAIVHLCEKLNISTILSRGAFNAEKVDSLVNKGYSIFDISGPELQEPSLFKNKRIKIASDEDTSSVAYYCHTSGTSSGAPKPIPQRQHQLLALLPSVDGFENTATFTTTPLYHGGIPDCLRAWSCGAMVWLFPEDVVPFTPSNVCSSVELAKKGPKPIWYFSCVPFVLQMLAEDEEAINLLRDMKLVGVGGAALDLPTGNALVDAGVNLISRLGSAECGFLMSSYRDFKTDKAWNYLRYNSNSKLLDFQPRDEDLFELVVTPSWPGRNLTNKPDGSYATSDLFKSHETVPNAWLYHSRADSQITLINGKKFDPEPAENHIRTSSKLVRDVLVFGNGKEYAGLILFASPDVRSKSDVVDAVWPVVDELNKSSQSHARVSKSALAVVLTDEHTTPLEKSSKGTILRNKAESTYADVIESAYSGRSDRDAHPSTLSLKDLRTVVEDTVSSVLGRQVDPDVDLFHQGVDSIAAIQVRTKLQNLCVPEGGAALSRSVVYDQGTINGLVTYLHDHRSCKGDSREPNGANGVSDQIQELAEMADTFKPQTGPRGGRTVVLTGATGFLGCHILDRLRQQATASDSPAIDRIVCLVRGASPMDRVSATLEKYSLPATSGSVHVKSLSCDLKLENLGLSEDGLEDIRQTAFLFIHCAWTVNFSVPTRAFRNDILGLQNLINLSMQSCAHFAFVSSTAAVSRMQTASIPIPESISHDPAHSSPLGYGQSKWAAERNCVKAWDVCKETPAQLDFPPLSVIRVGQLCGNQHGVWNMSEAYPLMLSTAAITGCLPDYPHKVLDWLPVEIAAQAVTDIALRNAVAKSESSLPPEPPVYHVLNKHAYPTWTHLIKWIQNTDTGKDIEALDPKEWIVRLQEGLTRVADHPSVALVGLWEQEVAQGASEEASFEVTNACQISPSLEKLQPLGHSRVMAIWEWVHDESRKMHTEKSNGNV